MAKKADIKKTTSKKAAKPKAKTAPKKTKEQRSADYKKIREAGFSSDIARRYRDLSTKDINRLIKTEKPKKINTKKQAAARKGSGYEIKNTYFRKYNYIIEFRRKNGELGYWTVISDEKLTNKQAIADARAIYFDAYDPGDNRQMHRNDSDSNKSKPLISSLRVIARYVSDRQENIFGRLNK